MNDNRILTKLDIRRPKKQPISEQIDLLSKNPGYILTPNELRAAMGLSTIEKETTYE